MGAYESNYRGSRYCTYIENAHATVSVAELPWFLRMCMASRTMGGGAVRAIGHSWHWNRSVGNNLKAEFS